MAEPIITQGMNIPGQKQGCGCGCGGALCGTAKQDCGCGCGGALCGSAWQELVWVDSRQLAEVQADPQRQASAGQVPADTCSAPGRR